MGDGATVPFSITQKLPVGFANDKIWNATKIAQVVREDIMAVYHGGCGNDEVVCVDSLTP